MPEVSVIIPTFNRGYVLKEAIESALNQSYKSFEVLVIDDGSTDDTANLVQPYLSRIRYLPQKNAGLSAARNRGIKEMKGRYAAFLDSDDVWLSDKLTRQMQYFQAHPQTALLSCKAEIINNQGHPLRKYKPSQFSEATFEGLLTANFMIASGSVVKKEVLEKTGGFDEKLRCYEDLDLWLRIALRHTLAFLNETLLLYRVSDDALTRNLANMYRAEIYSLGKIAKLELSKSQARLVKRRLKLAHYMLSKEYLNMFKFFEFLRHYLYAKSP